MIVRFADPHMFYLMLLLPLMIAGYIYKQRQGRSAMIVSTVEGVRSAPRSARYYMRHLPFVLKLAVVALLVAALARPQSASDTQSVSSNGVDIILLLDVSSTMEARDLQPNRLEAAKEVASKFVMDRKGDRMGLVLFAGESFTQVPLTTDRMTLISMLSKASTGMIEDGTAIGTGIATAVNRLRKSTSKSKVVILLTDGENNSGSIAPLMAAEVAAALGVKIYSIGVGTKGTAPMPSIDAWGRKVFVQAPVKIDEKLLRSIAEETGGIYYRATDKESLAGIYDRINSLEKSKIDVEETVVYGERYGMFVMAALVLAVVSLLVRHLYLKRIP
ncbi:MAG: VWA domain-containing protein [Rikenellaceae bacterium]|nr:VWA domain-containing protein [Rikenellaceae bacterium]